MATQQTSSGFGQSVEEDRGGFLRLALRLDALATGAVGALMLLAAGTAVGDGRPFVRMLGMPLAGLASLGLSLIVYAAFVWIVGSRRRVSGPGAWVAVVINVLYALGGVVAVAAGLFPLTALGVAFVLAQAAAVALFTALQFLGLRRSQPATG